MIFPTVSDPLQCQGVKAVGGHAATLARVAEILLGAVVLRAFGHNIVGSNTEPGSGS